MLRNISAIAVLPLLATASFLGTAMAQSAELAGFTEPYRQSNLASAETGTIERIHVREGQVVAAGEKLATLDCALHEASLAIAAHNVKAKGRLAAARATLQLRGVRLRKLKSLRAEGHARQEEVDRARTEWEIASANLLSAEEDVVTKRLEYVRIQRQIERRTIRSPLAGTVTRLHKQVGEFIAPNNPDLLTLVQVDRLLANFTMTRRQAAQLRPDQELEVRFVAGPSRKGTVHFISPVDDAESGTVLVKLKVDNADGKLHSGQRCKIHIAG